MGSPNCAPLFGLLCQGMKRRGDLDSVSLSRAVGLSRSVLGAGSRRVAGGGWKRVELSVGRLDRHSGGVSIKCVTLKTRWRSRGRAKTGRQEAP